MAAIIEFALPADEFALEHTLTTRPDAQIETERVVADAPDQITPYVWVRAEDFDAFETDVRDDPTVESMTLLSQTDDERSYQMTWTGSIDFVVQLLTEHQGTITHAETTDTRWHLRVVFPDRRHSLKRTTTLTMPASKLMFTRFTRQKISAHPTWTHRQTTQYSGHSLQRRVFRRSARGLTVGIRRIPGVVTPGDLRTAQTGNSPACRVNASHAQ